jgi:putative AlgH/UPF0301 family transcriptional regulator
MDILARLKWIAAIAALACGFAGGARAADVSGPVLLVASSMLDGSPFEQSVMLAAPLPDGGHIGFILNRRTSVSLHALFPDESATEKVTEPVYLGGTGLLPGVFAVTRNAPEGARGVLVPLMPGVVAVLDAPTVDRIITTTPNDARYFVGLMLWAPDELEEQVNAEQWAVRPADADVVLGAKAFGLWNALRGPWV